MTDRQIIILKWLYYRPIIMA